MSAFDSYYVFTSTHYQSVLVCVTQEPVTLERQKQNSGMIKIKFRFYACLFLPFSAVCS